MCRLVRFATLAAMAATPPLAAQARSVVPGDLVRFHPAPGGAYRVLEAHADSLIVLDRDHSQLSVPLRGVVVRRSRGLARGYSFARGLLYGAAAGATVGAADGFLQGDTPPNEAGLGSESAAHKTRVGAVLLGFVGTVAGGAAGLVRPARRWEVALPDAVRAGLSPSVRNGSPGLALSVRF